MTFTIQKIDKLKKNRHPFPGHSVLHHFPSLYKTAKYENAAQGSRNLTNKLGDRMHFLLLLRSTASSKINENVFREKED